MSRPESLRLGYDDLIQLLAKTEQNTCKTKIVKIPDRESSIHLEACRIRTRRPFYQQLPLASNQYLALLSKPTCEKLPPPPYRRGMINLNILKQNCLLLARPTLKIKKTKHSEQV